MGSTLGQPRNKLRRINLLSLGPWRKHKLWLTETETGTDTATGTWTGAQTNDSRDSRQSQKYATSQGTWASLAGEVGGYSWGRGS